MSPAQARACISLAPQIRQIASQLEAIESGRGFANLAFLRKYGLIATRREMLHTSTYSVPTGKTEFMLTAKGRQILTAANTVALQCPPGPSKGQP